MRRASKITNGFLWAALVVPLQQPSPQWYTPSFSQLKPNVVRFADAGLRIIVDSSSSPVFYKLPKPVEVKKLKARGQLFNYQSMKLGNNLEEPDDLPLRIGLVETSEETPSWIQKFFSPQWIKDIFEIFPGRGIKKVRFLTIHPNKPVGFSRIHPKSDILEETVALQQNSSGPFRIDYNFNPPTHAEAIWFQSDGDDSQSKFSVLIEQLSLE